MGAAAPGLLILPCGPGEAEALHRLHRRADPNGWSAESFRRLLSAASTLAFVASRGPEQPPQGFVVAMAAAGEAEVLMLAVDPDSRRAGLGLLLMQSLLAALAEAGIATLFLEVAVSNIPAQRLYRRLGFDEVGRRKGYYPADGDQPGEDALVMVREIEASASPVRV